MFGQIPLLSNVWFRVARFAGGMAMFGRRWNGRNGKESGELDHVVFLHPLADQRCALGANIAELNAALEPAGNRRSGAYRLVFSVPALVIRYASRVC